MVRLACSVPPDRSEGGAVGRMIGEGGGGGGRRGSILCKVNSGIHLWPLPNKAT